MTQSAAAPVAPTTPQSTTQPAHARPKAPPPRDETNVKETVESILVAFILAFIFRAFVVEAFVIPTGSMAPTLLGAHMRFACGDCGYKFTVNYSGRNDGDDVIVPSFSPNVLPVHCPNCGYKLPRNDPADPGNDATTPPVFYGDRILVMKYRYLFREPRRWDVVVFKSPNAPDQHDYQQNYIKRLVGLPGEGLMVLDGDVYTAAPAPGPDRLRDPGDWRVQPKPPHVQEALWRIVYDNDFHPQGLPRAGAAPFAQPWRPAGGSGWTTPTALPAARTFSFAGESGALAFDPAANPVTNGLTDFLAYDMLTDIDDRVRETRVPIDLYNHRSLTQWTNVSDLKLDLHYRRTDGSGPLRLAMSKLGETFVAEILPDRVRLLRASGDGPEREVAARQFAWPDRAARVRFQNVDYRVTLSVDGDELLQSGDDYGPDVAALMRAYADRTNLPKPTVRIEARQQSAVVSHVGLFRDVYYTNSDRRLAWATPASPIELGADEFFTCGDNSLVSEDGRYWRQPIRLPEEDLVVEAGRVPRRFMLGKAFFVYWPAGYRPINGAPGMTPNFGEMRFIH